MLPAGSEPQSPFGSEQKYIAADQKQDPDDQENINGKGADLINKGCIAVGQLC